MYLVKKKWGAPHGLAPEAILLEDANGTSLSDGSIPEEMGWTIASPSDPPVCTVYAIPKFDEHAHNPQVKAGRPICARPLAAENLAVPSLALAEGPSSPTPPTSFGVSVGGSSEETLAWD